MELDQLFLKRTPPHSLEAERTVLGGILVQNENLNVVLSVLKPDDFYKDAHRTILERASGLIDKGQPVDLLTLSEDLKRAGRLDEIGGSAYLASLLDGVPRSLNVEYYARIIKEKALLRRLILSSARIISDSYDEKGEADELLSEAQTAIVEVAEERIRPGFIPVGQLTDHTLEVVKSRQENKQAVIGVPTGYPKLDQLTSGFHPQELLIIAARPSMGKTALALNISLNIGVNTDYAVGFFSMEMAKEQIVLRLLCAKARVDISRARSGFINDREYGQLVLAAEALTKSRIFIDESAALSIMEMKAKCRRLKLEKHLDIVFVDYIQLMRAGGRFENRNQEMSFISRSLKELAKELMIPVVGISQLSRAPEKRQGGGLKPQLSDLRESGAIEQDADVVMFIFRPEYYDPENEEHKGKAEINIAKQRNGPTGNLNLAFLRSFGLFAESEDWKPEF